MFEGTEDLFHGIGTISHVTAKARVFCMFWQKKELKQDIHDFTKIETTLTSEN